jgi:fructoselysine-6-P-deglycase FrlB-like protein
VNYPIAPEGALKLKEISYIHAEGYPAGEMKHGPIALIDEAMPVVALAPRDAVFEKMLGNIQEAKARGGSVIAITSEGDSPLVDLLDRSSDALVAILQLPAAHSRRDHHSAAATCVPYCHSAWLRCRSTEESRQERHSRIGGLDLSSPL